MRLLFVHEVNWQRKVVYEIHDFPELLSLRGHEVVFIDYPEGEDRHGLRRWLDLTTTVSAGLSRAHTGGSVEVRTPGRVLPPPLDRPLASLTHVPEIWKALRHGHFDAVVLYGVPTNGWQTVKLAKRAGVPVLFRAIDISHALRPTRVGKLIERAEHYIYRHADAISANNVALARYVVEHGAAAEGVAVEYPGLDLERFHPGPSSPVLRARYGLSPDHRVVAFMGTLFRFSGLDWFIDGFAETLRSSPEVRLLILGGGEASDALHAQVDRLGLGGSVVFTGFVDYPDLADHLRLAHVAINPFTPSLVTRYALPGKILQYLGCGLPTVCTHLDGMEGMVPDGEGVLYREMGAPFVDAVNLLLSNEPQRSAAAALARSTMERRCQWDTCTTAMEHAIERAISRAAVS